MCQFKDIRSRVKPVLSKIYLEIIIIEKSLKMPVAGSNRFSQKINLEIVYNNRKDLKDVRNRFKPVPSKINLKIVTTEKPNFKS